MIKNVIYFNWRNPNETLYIKINETLKTAKISEKNL